MKIKKQMGALVLLAVLIGIALGCSGLYVYQKTRPLPYYCYENNSSVIYAMVTKPECMATSDFKQGWDLESQNGFFNDYSASVCNDPQSDQAASICNAAYLIYTTTYGALSIQDEVENQKNDRN